MHLKKGKRGNKWVATEYATEESWNKMPMCSQDKLVKGQDC